MKETDMAGKGGDSGQGFEALARQYWNAWGQALREGGAAESGAQDWSQALGWWRGLLGERTPAVAQDAVDRFSGQAGDWLGLMQQVAARFAGRDTSSAEVAGAWRQAVQGQEEGLLQWTLGALRGGVAGGFDPWLEQAARQLAQWQRDSAPWLDMPAFGVGRNHQARWQDFVRLQQDHQAQAQAYVQQLRTALDQAFDRFQSKLETHEDLGRQLTSARALFDLWIEAAEEAYTAVALSEQFRQAYGAYANAHMRLRAAVQQEIEQIAGQYGLPTRSEMDAAHRRIAELERLVRRLAAAQGQGPQAAPGRTARAAPAGQGTARSAGQGAEAGRASERASPANARKTARGGASTQGKSQPGTAERAGKRAAAPRLAGKPRAPGRAGKPR